jgi:bacterial/archaeal transporter family protein
MWIWASVLSAVFLGFYDVAKKHSLKSNDVLHVLFFSTLFSSLLLAAFLSHGPAEDHLKLVIKALIVTSSWVSGLMAMQLLPLTTVSMVKASRPVFVLLFSLLLFGERLNALQWAGSIISFYALFMLSRTSNREGISFTRSRGMLYLAISVATGVGSALYDRHIMKSLEPLFVQSWTNVYITLIMALLLVGMKLWTGRRAASEETSEWFKPFRWDWTLLLIAALITLADFLYFYALSCPDTMLSIVSIVRRSSVIVPFIFGAILFKEKNIRAKALDLAVLLAGMFLIVLGS